MAEDRFSDDELLDPMLTHPVLTNRPVVITQFGTKLGCPSEEILDILPHAQQGAFIKEDVEALIDEQCKRIVHGRCHSGA